MQKKFKILLATDYSDAVSSAEKYAIQFAKSTGSDIRIVHTYEIPIGYTPAKPIAFSKSRKEFYDSELAILEQHCEKVFHSLNVESDMINCEYTVREGRAGKQIREVSEDWEADFIIMGTHGISGLGQFFYGTHTWDVIKKSCVPVLAIPLGADFISIKNIVFALEEREGELKAVNYCVQLAKSFDANVNIVHLTNYILSKEFEVEMIEKFIKEIKDKIEYNKLNIRLEYNQDIIRGINDYCSRTKADWLVMAPEKLSLYEKIIMLDYSVTKNLSFITRTPLLALPEYFNTDNSKFWELFNLEEIPQGMPAS